MSRKTCFILAIFAYNSAFLACIEEKTSTYLGYQQEQLNQQNLSTSPRNNNFQILQKEQPRADLEQIAFESRLEKYEAYLANIHSIIKTTVLPFWLIYKLFDWINSPYTPATEDDYLEIF